MRDGELESQMTRQAKSKREVATQKRRMPKPIAFPLDRPYFLRQAARLRFRSECLLWTQCYRPGNPEAAASPQKRQQTRRSPQLVNKAVGRR